MTTHISFDEDTQLYVDMTGKDGAEAHRPDASFPWGTGPMAEKIRAVDWAASPLGPMDSWPSELRCTLSTILDSTFPFFLAWGPELNAFWNDAYQPFFFDREVNPGMRFRDLWPEAWATVGPLAVAALNGKPSYFEDLPIKLLRGGVMEQTWWTFGYSPVRVGDGSVGGMLATVADTTRHVLQQRELASSREAVSRFNDLVPDLLWEADAQGEICVMNQAMKNFTGLTVEQATDWTSFVHPDDIAGIVAKSAAALECSGNFESQHRLRRADGTYRWVLARANPTLGPDGDITGWYGCASDIHDWKTAVDQLGQSQELLCRFAEGAAQGMWIAQIGSGDVEFLNIAARQFWEQHGPAGVTTSASWFDIIDCEDQVLVADAISRLKAGETVEATFRLAEACTDAMQLRATLFPIREPHGPPVRFGGVAQLVAGKSKRLVHLVDPDRDSSRRLSSQLWENGFEVHSFFDVLAFTRVAPSLMPGLVILRADGHVDWLARAAVAARQTRSRLCTIVMSSEHRDVDHVRELMKLGVHDVISAEAEWDAIASVILRTPCENEAGDGPRAGGVVDATERMARLSKREREILDRLVSGTTNKIIARELGISPRTVETHRSRILERLEVATLAEAIGVAIAARMTYLPGT